jgi:hypothetical protein
MVIDFTIYVVNMEHDHFILVYFGQYVYEK